ncbi:hypothetical protein AHAS_Ahas05G0166200 [Arachis hypogaea]
MARMEAMLANLGKEFKDMRTFQEEVRSSIQNRGVAIKKFEAYVGYLSKQITTHNSLSGTMANPREESEEQEKEAPIPSEIPMKKEEVVRVYKPKALYPQGLLRVTKECANSFPEDSMQHHKEEREKGNQGSPHSNETESCIEDEFIEPLIQEALDEKDALTVQQHPSFEIKDVKTIEISTKIRIVTEKQRTISMKKRSTQNKGH